MEQAINLEEQISFTEKYNVDLEVIERTKLIAQLVNMRLEAGLTQSELAKEVGMTQAQVSKIEKGTQSPRLDTIIKLANYYKKELILN